MKRRYKAWGFTLVEVLIAMVIVAILVNIAIPSYQSLKFRAQGAAVVGDVKAIETAAFDFFARTGSFPPTAFGSVPSGLGESLPSGFEFVNGETTYGWIAIDFPGVRIIGTIVNNPNPEIMTRVLQSHSGSILGGGGLVILLIE